MVSAKGLETTSNFLTIGFETGPRGKHAITIRVHWSLCLIFIQQAALLYGIQIKPLCAQ